MKNVKLTPKKNVSAWDKISVGSWKVNGDSQVYCELKLEVEPALEYLKKLNQSSPNKITITHFLGGVMGRVLKETPDLNTMIRFSKIYYREEANIFFHVADKSDLSGKCIKNIDKLSLSEIANELTRSAKDIRAKKDPTFKKIKSSWRLIPSQLSKPLMGLIRFVLFGLNIHVKAFGMPQDPFGGMMITNIGSLGFDNAFVPLPPYTQVPIICALGRIGFEPVCNNQGQIESKKLVSLCFTFDHRILDGYRGSKVVEKIKNYFQNPELIEGEIL